MLNQIEIKKLLHYNPETGIFTWLNSISNVVANSIAGNKNNKEYICIGINKKSYLAHRLAWLYMYGYFPKMIDHINGIKDDNRLCNLRDVTQSQNMLNRKINKNSISGIKGITWKKQYQKWQAELRINGKKKHFGYFDDIELAELVVQKARNKYHKEFANHGGY